MVHWVCVCVQNHIGLKWSVIITDHLKMKKNLFEIFGEPYGPQEGGKGGQNHIGSKWSVIITDHFRTNVVPTPPPLPVRTTLHTRTDWR